MSDALLIVAHGTRDPAGRAEALEFGRFVAARHSDQLTELAFLEFGPPSISDAIERLATAGARRIVCQPGMLFAAGHVKRDIPQQLHSAYRRWPDMQFALGAELGVDARLVELCRVRWNEAMALQCTKTCEETALLLVGRGSSDSEATAGLHQIAALLKSSYQVGRAMACFCDVASPSVAEAFLAVLSTGARRVVVQPYLLFTGMLVKTLHEWVGDTANKYADVEVVATQHLGIHPLLAEVFEERARMASCQPWPARS